MLLLLACLVFVEQGLGTLEQFEYLLLVSHERNGILAADWHEVVADMLFAGICDTLEAVKHLHECPNGQEVPGVAFYAEYVIYSSQSQYLFAPLPLELLTLFLNACGSLFERAIFLAEECVCHLLVAFCHKSKLFTPIESEMLDEQCPVFRFIVRTHDLREEGILHLLCILVGLFHITLYQEYDGQCDADGHGREMSEVHDAGHQISSDEGHASRYEPSAYDGNHSCDAEHCALAAPCSVGQTGSHGHHESDIGGGEGQFQTGSHGNQQPCQYQIDCRAHLVKGSSGR